MNFIALTATADPFRESTQGTAQSDARRILAAPTRSCGELPVAQAKMQAPCDELSPGRRKSSESTQKALVVLLQEDGFGGSWMDTAGRATP